MARLPLASQACVFSQGEPESGRAGVPVGTERACEASGIRSTPVHTDAAFNAAKIVRTSIGSSVIIVVIAIALGSVPPITRIVRSLTLDERTKDYVNTARLRGERRRYILMREILPNVSGPIIVDSCIRVGYAIMAIGSLGFLGLGIPPPTPERGGMINEGRKWIFSMPWTVVAPAAALSSVVIGLDLLADGIREIGQQR